MSHKHFISNWWLYWLPYLLHWLLPFLFLLNGIITNIKIIKENNLVDLNKFYFTFHEAGSLYSQESTELQSKGERLHALVKRGQQEARRKYLAEIDWPKLYIWLYSERSRNKEVSAEPRAGLVFGNWLAAYIALLVKNNIYRDTKLSKFRFALWTGAAPPWA